MKNKNGTTVKRVLNTVKQYRIYVILSLLFSALSAVLTLYIPILAGKAIDGITENGGIDFEIITVNLLKIVVCALLSALFQWLMSIINNRIAYSTVKDLRERAFSNIQHLPLAYIDAHPYGDIVSRIIADAEQFSDGLLLGFSQLFSGVVTILITLVFMLYLSPLIALVVVILTPISLFISKFIASKTYNFFKDQSVTRGEQTALINEMVENGKTVKAFSYENTAASRFDEVNERLRKCSLKAIFFSSLTNPTTRFVNNLIYAAVGLTGGFAAIGGMLTVGGFVSFLSYANQYTKPFNEISGVVTELQNALACAGRLFDLCDIEPETEDLPDAVILENPKGKVEIKDLSFSYDKSKTLLKDLNLNIKAGSKVAVVGPTGCGKTTLINLLMRFYDADKGEILIDGTEIKNMPRKSLRHSYGMVLQDTWLKNGTVKENIAYGKPDATDEEIIAAAKAVHAHGFIKRLPNGYDTLINESGVRLSAGEMQLLSIARVMLINPSMLILDEATSSIDTRTELKVQDAFKKLTEGKTSFVVAHRLSTILDSDLILVMNEGNIIEQGTHTELLA
ncbi:MAG: ABC transporter ATP-binding protein, partial [Acutalibacteraceae bacterium]|nr:ABC transporter ATP-binding protein [Acutalibacteraceae bacterium]